ncbi:MAG: hypothetical protein PHV37_05530 [Candidatus Gastranaerophilales bacterium]|nr:hypothetical protein [Candidatus Gastranaerophilales bacterium]
MQLSKIDALAGCQPLKQSVSAVPLREVAFRAMAPDTFENKTAPKNDTFQSNTQNIDAKYDFACRLAAFYKQQYEQLLQQKACNA